MAKKKRIESISLDPMLAKLAREPFDDPEWVFEVKWDGYRLMACKDRSVRLFSRRGLDQTKKYEAIAEALAPLPGRAVLDGELVALDERGRPSFQALQQFEEKRPPLLYCAFDLLYLDGEDLRDRPLLERKERLRTLLPKSEQVRYSEHVEERGTSYFAAALKEGLEGVMAKRAQSPYRSGERSGDWLKVKTSQRQEVVIVGYTAPRRSRKHIGSLVLAVRDGDQWRYVGHTGGGMGGISLEEMHRHLTPLEIRRQPLEVPAAVARGAQWVRPTLVGEVQFTEWTESGTMRHPVFMGLRPDKRPAEVRRESAAAPRRGRQRARKSGAREEVPLSNTEKVFWPREGYTKGDVIAYYDRMASTILPYLKDRPFVLNRHPNGIGKPGFYQKDVSDLQLPSFVETATIRSESNDKDIKYALCNNRETLLYLANLGCIELNPWNSRVGSLEQPDFFVIDLDPGTNTFDQVVEVAKAVRDVLEIACDESCVKTSGKTGLHVYVPLRGKDPYEQVRAFAELLVRIVHQRLPSLTSLERSPKKRRNKIYLDWLQNRVGQTLAAPYSLRPAPHATVSAPLEWKEVRKGLRPEQFTIETIEKRLKKKGDLWKKVLTGGVELREALRCLEEELGSSKKRRRLRR